MGAPDVAIIGGGLIGLGIAWRAAAVGLRVTVVDPAPGTGASWAAAGMLAPVTEVHYGEEPLLALNLAAARRYPEFVAELESAGGEGVGYRTCGTLSIAFDADDDAALDELHGHQLRLGLPVRRLSGRECRRLEPMLAPAIRGGVLAEADHQVDNRRLVTALLAAAERVGVVIDRRLAERVLVSGARAAGVVLEDGETVASGAVVIAAGCWSGRLGGAGAEVVRPVKGQVLVLRGPAEPPLISRTVRGLVRGSSVYLVPREDGRIIAGATMEERGFDVRTTVEATRVLLRDAQLLAPGVDDLELLEVGAGLRPGTPDNAPLLGATEVDGLVLATGHHRNGVLLTPVTADAITALLVDGSTPDLIAPFSPLRFARAGPRAPVGAAV